MLWSSASRRPSEQRHAEEYGSAIEHVVDEPEYAAIDQTAVTQLLYDVAQLAMSKRLGSDVDAQPAMDAVVSLVLDAQLVAALVDAHHTDGASGSLAVLNRAGQAGLLGWLTDLPTPVPVMQTMMGGAPGGVPGLPGLPGGGLPGGGLPGGGVPGWPGGPGVPKGPGTPVDEWIAALLKKYRKPKHWDPTKWDHKYPWWQDDLNWIDPRVTKFIACIIAARRIMNALSEPPPPPPTPPQMAVWNTGITHVSGSAVPAPVTPSPSVATDSAAPNRPTRCCCCRPSTVAASSTPSRGRTPASPRSSPCASPPDPSGSATRPTSTPTTPGSHG